MEQPRILYSCYAHVSREGEQFVPQHILSYLISGSGEVSVNGETLSSRQGDFRFMKRNQLARFVKHPPADGEYKVISIGIDQETLRSVSAENNLHLSQPYTGPGILHLHPDPLLVNYIDSLKPYLDNGNSPELIRLKVKEAVLLLVKTNPGLKDALFDFSEPGKIDLEAFMNENYRYSVDMKRFAYLSGRSLATFKRDFEKVFHSSPNKWIQQKRLNDALFLIRDKGRRPSDVYLEVGFKDFSHFSFAFRKAFGTTPSSITH